MQSPNVARRWALKESHRALLAGRTLSGDRNQCPGCGLLFNSSYAFDKHRNAGKGQPRRCLSPVELTAKGWATNAAGFWVTELMPPKSPELRGREGQKASEVVSA